MKKVWTLKIVKSRKGEENETIYNEYFATKCSAELTATQFVDEMRKKYAKPNGVCAEYYADKVDLTVYDEDNINRLVIFNLTFEEHNIHEINAYDEHKGFVPPTDL